MGRLPKDPRLERRLQGSVRESMFRAEKARRRAGVRGADRQSVVGRHRRVDPAEGAVTELFDVAVIPGVRRPTATGFLNEEIHKLFTIEA